MPGHRDGEIRAIALARALGHRHARLRRDGAVALERLVRDAQLGLLETVAVADDAAHEVVARAGDLSEHVRDQAAGARLGRGQFQSRAQASMSWIRRASATSGRELSTALGSRHRQQGEAGCGAWPGLTIQLPSWPA